MRRRLVPILVFCLAALAACERRDAPNPGTAPGQSATADGRFRHRLSGDVSGGYRPVAETSGGWRVESLFIGQPAAFEAWEAGRREAAPLILVLSGPEGRIRLTPRVYDLTDDSLHLVADTGAGTADDGKATLDARIDQGGLATARRNLGDRTPVITGSLTIGSERVPFSLGWWNGD